MLALELTFVMTYQKGLVQKEHVPDNGRTDA